MTMRQFLKDHREEIDQAIHDTCSYSTSINDYERELWTRNDEFFYNLAKSIGVNI